MCWQFYQALFWAVLYSPGLPSACPSRPFVWCLGLHIKWKNRTEGAGSPFWSPENPALNSDDTTGPCFLQAQGGEQPPYGRHLGGPILGPSPIPAAAR